MESKAEALAKQSKAEALAKEFQSLLLWRFKTPSQRWIGWSPNL